MKKVWGGAWISKKSPYVCPVDEAQHICRLTQPPPTTPPGVPPQGEWEGLEGGQMVTPRVALQPLLLPRLHSDETPCLTAVLMTAADNVDSNHPDVLGRCLTAKGDERRKCCLK